MDLLNNKWVNINEMVAYKQIFTGNNKAPIMYLIRYVDEVNRWFYKVKYGHMIHVLRGTRLPLLKVGVNLQIASA
jgi:hypothetical protein